MINKELIDNFMEFLHATKLDMYCKSEENREILSFTLGTVGLEIGVYNVYGNYEYCDAKTGEPMRYWGYIRDMSWRDMQPAPEYNPSYADQSLYPDGMDYKVCNIYNGAYTNITDLLYKLMAHYITKTVDMYMHNIDILKSIDRYRYELFKSNSDVMEATEYLE